MKEIFIISFFLIPCLIDASNIQYIPLIKGQVTILNGASSNNTFYMDGRNITSSILELSFTTFFLYSHSYCLTERAPKLESTVNNCQFKDFHFLRKQNLNNTHIIIYYDVPIDKQYIIVKYTAFGMSKVDIEDIRYNNKNKNPSSPYYTFDEIDIIFIAIVSGIILIILIYIIIFLCKSKKIVGDVTSEPTHPTAYYI